MGHLRLLRYFAMWRLQWAWLSSASQASIFVLLGTGGHVYGERFSSEDSALYCVRATYKHNNHECRSAPCSTSQVSLALVHHVMCQNHPNRNFCYAFWLYFEKYSRFTLAFPKTSVTLQKLQATMVKRILKSYWHYCSVQIVQTEAPLWLSSR